MSDPAEEDIVVKLRRTTDPLQVEAAGIIESLRFQLASRIEFAKKEAEK